VGSLSAQGEAAIQSKSASTRIVRHWPAAVAAVLLLVCGMAAPRAFAQNGQKAARAPSSPSDSTGTANQPPKPSSSSPTHITPEQAKQLFRSVDTILRFDSRVTGLPILHPVKRRLVSRDQVVEYLDSQLKKSRDARRLERSELVLKKFGLLDRNFDLRTFLVKLLREQIAGYYDDKTGTVNLLDWVPPDEQKPVLAHELTHALQDQHVHLDKWDQQSDLSISKNVQQDNRHIATDEEDTARDAVAEGQAMAVFVDYVLAPTGRTLLDVPPDIIGRLDAATSNSTQAPILSKAPLVLQRSLLFPYTEGLTFVRTVLAARGKQGAFAGLLDDPPTSSYQIMTPVAYLRHLPVPVLRMPDIHPLIHDRYLPYDIGVIGEFDVQVLAEQFGGTALSKELTPAWRGGIYFAAQRRSAKTDAERNSPDSLALLYLSRWSSTKAAQSFADMMAREIPRQYPEAKPLKGAKDASSSGTSQGWSTSAGPILIVVSGKTVFLSESFPLNLALKLEPIMIGSVTGNATSQVAQSATRGKELTTGLRAWAVGSEALVNRETMRSVSACARAGSARCRTIY
jgi:hypothetical protein